MAGFGAAAGTPGHKSTLLLIRKRLRVKYFYILNLDLSLNLTELKLGFIIYKMTIIPTFQGCEN